MSKLTFFLEGRIKNCLKPAIVKKILVKEYYYKCLLILDFCCIDVAMIWHIFLFFGCMTYKMHMFYLPLRKKSNELV